MNDEFETLGYFVPKGVLAICLSCKAKKNAMHGYNNDVEYVHIKENYLPLEDIYCDYCNELILARKVPDKVLTDNQVK